MIKLYTMEKLKEEMKKSDQIKENYSFALSELYRLKESINARINYIISKKEEFETKSWLIEKEIRRRNGDI